MSLGASLFDRRRADDQAQNLRRAMIIIANAANAVDEAASLLRRGDWQSAFDLAYPLAADLRATLKLLRGDRT